MVNECAVTWVAHAIRLVGWLKHILYSSSSSSQVISRGMKHRKMGSHELNLESSRSHSIMTVYIDAVTTSPDDHDYGIPKFGKVSFVDLAGSERLKDTKSAGEMLKETANINKSLFTLGKVCLATLTFCCSLLCCKMRCVSCSLMPWSATVELKNILQCLKTCHGFLGKSSATQIRMPIRHCHMPSAIGR